MRYLFTLLLYLSVQTLSFAAPLKDFTVSYDLYYNEMYVGQTTRNLVTEKNNINFSSIATTLKQVNYGIKITS